MAIVVTVMNIISSTTDSCVGQFMKKKVHIQ